MGDTIIGTVIANTVSSLIVGPIGFFAGKISARNEERRHVVQQKIDDVVASVRNLSDEAQSYFISEMDARDRAALSVNVTSKMKRISNDLVSIAKYAGFNEQVYLASWRGFFNTITSFPFGNEDFRHEDVPDGLVVDIQNSENNLISAIRAACSKVTA